MTTEEKLKRFMDTSIEDTKNQSALDIQKYSDALEAEFEEYKASIDSQNEQRIKAESQAIIVKTNRELSQKQIEIKRTVGKKQSELTNKLFAEIHDLIGKFMSTPEYFQLLTKQIKDAVAFAGTDEITIYIDPADESHVSSLQNVTGVPIEVSKYSFEGGTRAVIRSKNILIDNSFEKKFAEYKESFTFKC